MGSWMLTWSMYMLAWNGRPPNPAVMALRQGEGKGTAGVGGSMIGRVSYSQMVTCGGIDDRTRVIL
jgi:hypothetical protein